MIKDINYFSHLPYSFKIEWSDINACYIATVTCKSCGLQRQNSFLLSRPGCAVYIRACVGSGLSTVGVVRISKA